MNRVRYVGPANQLRGKTGISTASPRATVPKGFLAVQFDQLDLVVNGKPMAYTWTMIKEEYLRPFEPIVQINIERMTKALAGPRHVMPDNLQREEFREWLLAKAKETKNPDFSLIGIREMPPMEHDE